MHTLRFSFNYLNRRNRFKGRHSKQIGEGEEDIYVSNKDLNLQSNSELLWEMEALLYSENMLMLNIQNVNQTK